MKVLFVCWANVGRSQMAATIYNQLTNTNDASSAGTEVQHPGKDLLERRNRRGGTYTIDVMADEGIDVSKNIRTQINEDMLERFDLVVNMAEPEHTPKWLSQSPNYVYWYIKDPGDSGYDAALKAKEEIKSKVKGLMSNLKTFPRT